ncbi:hypothetical protein MVEG_11009 [Podila verticillata NRRL 6337]|uniref:Carrier domain-containing protein n=1 Tax=Podila verticillata NRRL 6337 TaxID=1069443 RepID=A0A086TLZ4_9FUNG|nr:hypothetical protein MVEG_11009 [Podila verticillata NRRL 6337]
MANEKLNEDGSLRESDPPERNELQALDTRNTEISGHQSLEDTDDSSIYSVDLGVPRNDDDLSFSPENQALSLDLPTDRARAPSQSMEAAILPIQVGGHLAQLLKDLSQKEDVHLQVPFLAAWTVVLSRLSDQQKFTVAFPNVSLDHNIDSAAKFISLDVHLSRALPAAQLFAHFNNALLQANNLRQPSSDSFVLPQVAFIWTDHSQEWRHSLESSAFPANTSSSFEIELRLHDTNGKIEGALLYATALFDVSTIERHATYLISALESLVKDPMLPVNNINILPPSELEMLLHTWNATSAAYPSDHCLHEQGELCIHQLFEQQVERTPDAIALVFEDQSLTYGQLNAHANRLAHILIGRGIQPDNLVAICFERSLELIIAILAVLKAGAAYVPLDPVHASERLLGILQDASPSLVLVDALGAKTLLKADLPVVVVDKVDRKVQVGSINPHISTLSSRHLAYVIYTSGSTGKPKGVMVEHRQVTRLLAATASWYNFNRDDTWCLLHSFAFDVSVWEIWGALRFGGRLVIVSQDVVRSTAELRQKIKGEQVTVLNMTPSAFASLIEEDAGVGLGSSLRYVVFAGEALQPSMLRPWFKTHANDAPRMINMYGITETTVHVTYRRMTLEDCDLSTSPIGQRIPDLRTYVLDSHRQIAPLGTVGELYVGGAGLARGYLNRPELTAKTFIRDPFVNDPEARMYKTGDLARFLPDGSLVYLGRNDHQVKIRGFRIELGEIEACLNEHPSVTNSAVLVMGEDLERRLVAYVLTLPGNPADEIVNAQLATTLRSYVASRVPEYMVPSAFVRLDEFPLTPNGKLDRRALPEPGDNALARQEYEEPQGEVEKALAVIWTELLHVDRISRHDSFFALGGHSLLAVQMVSRLQQLGHSLSVRAVFDTPVLSTLAANVGELREIAIPPNLITAGTDKITPDLLPLIDLSQAEIDLIVESVLGGVTNVQDIYGLSPLQDGILFHHLKASAGDPYLLYVSCAFDDKDSLDNYLHTMQQVVDRHDILRTGFVWEKLSNPVQVVWRSAQLSITELQLDPADGPIAQQLRTRFHPGHFRIDLAQAPLLRFFAAQESDGRWILVTLLHHLISDHSTLETMNSEIRSLQDGLGHTLPKSEPFRNLIVHIRSGLRQSEHDRFFKEMLADIETPSLCYDLTDVHANGYMMAESHRELSQDIHDRLRMQAKRLGVSLASICHVAWALVVARTSGQQHVVYGTVLLGRMQANMDSSRAMGLFINTLPIAINTGDCSVEDSVRQTHARLAALLEYEHASLALAQRCSGVPAGVPLFNSLLNYHHDVAPGDRTSALPGMEHMEFHESTNYPIGLSVEDDGVSLGVTAQVIQPFNSERICGYMQQALENLAHALDLPEPPKVCTLDVVPADEIELLIQTWNMAQDVQPEGLCIHHLFEQQVERAPEAIALVFEGQSLTYGELNTRANRLAHNLVDRGVRPDSLVAICVERSVAMIVSILAVLKAGGAYVPLDPAYASDRLRDILDDAAPAVLLVDNVGRKALGDKRLSGIACVDPNVQERRQVDNPHIDGLTTSHLAYVIYTSGSTGKPKGVLVEHRGVIDVICSEVDMFQVDSSSRLLQFTSISFDNSVSEIFSAFKSGASLYLVQDDVRMDRDRLWNFMAANEITYISVTPTMLQGCEEMPVLESLRAVIVMGEAMPIVLPRAVKTIAPNCTIVNAYGPTETTIGALAWKYSPCLDAVIAPIGRPNPNTRIYILDAYGRPVPLGAVGELYIGGVGVARGYLNRPDLTAERFVTDPFVEDPEARMYKTGDLVSYLPDGNVVYLGRNDHQVKIRGFRIELGEIEARLIEHPLLSKAVVVARGNGSNKRLVGYVLTNTSMFQETPSESLAQTLRSYLAAALPEYMVPSAFVRLESFPLTPNGKLDLQALPEPSDVDLARVAYEEPQGEIETALASIWIDLLCVDSVGRHDSFFALGGHSLLAVRMLNRVTTLAAGISLASLFTSPSLAAFASVIRESQEQCEMQPTIEPAPRDGKLALSFAQQRMWFLAQLDGVSATYHIPLAARFIGCLNLEAWQLAVQSLVARHEALRSIFVSADGQPHVEIMSSEAFSSRYIDLRDSEDSGGHLSALVEKESTECFNLSKGPLIRAVLFQVADNEHVFVLTQHHIVSDGWSMAVMIRELNELYSSHCRGAADSLPPLPIQYPDYAVWQRQWLTGDRLDDQAEYWRKNLTGAPVLIDLPTDRPRPVQQSFAGSTIPISLDSELTSALKRLSQEHGTTLFMVIMAAWSAVLSRLSGQDDIVIGTPSANRGRSEIESLIGLFVNTLALRIDLSGEPTMMDVLDRVRRAALSAHDHQDLPFEQVVEIVQPPRSMGHTPLFQVMFAWQNNDDVSWDLVDLETSHYNLDISTIKFDLELGLHESEGKIVGELGYSTALFEQSTIERHVGYLTEMLREMSINIDAPVHAVDILSPTERTLLLDKWNTTQEIETEDLCIHQLFERQAERTPEAVALVFEDQSLTYGQLNAHANRLAHILIGRGIQPDNLVAICFERSLELIIAILAVLKAGAAYVPLDPVHASERLLGILQDASPSLVLVDALGAKTLLKADLPVVVVDKVDRKVQVVSTNPHIPTLSPRHLAYVIYTSGSTGKPKGVMIEHRQVTRLFTATEAWFGFNQADTWCLLHSYAFDFSVWEIWGALRYGGKLVIMSQGILRSVVELRRVIKDEKITVLNMTPSAFTALVHDDAGAALGDSIRYVIFGGEALQPAMLEQWFQTHVNDAPRMINMYGITETTVFVTYRPMILEDCDLSTSPIGERIPDLTTYILDSHRQLAPLGTVGELYVGGAGLARGYLNRPELTAKTFIRDPFVNDPEARMYKTGDLARFLPDGSLVYLGRNDHQVKIRGFRIELGEIEACLNEHPSVTNSAVLVMGEDLERRLVAYVLTFPGNPADEIVNAQLATTLRTYVASRVPEYMVPSAFVRLDEFPLTPNGKLDRRALPEPGDNALARQEYEEPQGEVEKALAVIWTELLHVDRISRNDTFFALGGHSLMAVRMLNRVATLGAGISLGSLFTSPSLAAFASVIRESQEQTVIQLAIEQAPRDGKLALSFAQQRMWFLAQLDGVSGTYHMPLVTRFTGFLNQEAWQLAVQSLGCSPRSIAFDLLAFSSRYIDLRDSEDSEGHLSALVEKESTESFNLSKGPLIRAVLFQVSDNEHVFALTQHHIVSDGWSVAIMIRELNELYSSHCRGAADPLPPLPIQYPDYAVWQRQWFTRERLDVQAEYWRKNLTGAPVLIDLPTDRPRPVQQSFAGSTIPISLDSELTSALKRLSQEHGTTLFMVIMAAWSAVLSRLSGQDDIVIGTPSANRGRSEIESLIGLFVNTLALRIDLSSDPTARDLLGRVRRAALSAHDHQDLPFEQVVEIVQPPRSMGHTPLFQVMFAWQNNDDVSWDLVDLETSHYNLDISTIKFDLELGLHESEGKIVGELGYSTALFEQSTIERHVGYLTEMLREMSINIDAPVHAVDILSPTERTLLLDRWNTTQETESEDLCIHQMFEQQVERTPEAIALVFEDQSLTYGELNTRANHLAHNLVDLGVRPDKLVAICVKRSLSMIVGILAILKAGGAYVPLDPSFASDRLRDTLCDAAPVCLLADSEGRTALGVNTVMNIPVLDPNDDSEVYLSSNVLVPDLTPMHLAYVIYTSGTTGKPKGVMVGHQGVANLIYFRQRAYNFDSQTRSTQFFTFSFDSSVSEIFPTLCSGGSLYILSDSVRMDKTLLWSYLENNAITHILLTPAILQDSTGLPPLRSSITVILAGEALPPAFVRELKTLVPHGAIINEYGPTEATVASTYWKVLPDICNDTVPIGRPIPNKRIYILDSSCRPVPVGVIGELYIGGVGVARGYMNRPDLTVERFLVDPFVEDPNARMYKTGDMARYLPDGNVAYLGRNDHQIKIRGFRIELGEIEARLIEHPLLSKAVVVARGNSSNMRLVGYVLTNPSMFQETPSESLAQTLRSYLAAALPEYMVPSAFVRLESFPLTPNGKLDLQALPEPSDVDLARVAYEEPQGEIETALASIWIDLLCVDSVGRHDSFFALGGHSLLAVRMLNRVTTLAAGISLASLFTSPSLAAFASVIRESQEQCEMQPTIEPAPRDGKLALSFAQQRMWFLAQLDGVSATYHIPLAARFIGCLNLEAWQLAVQSLVARHEALRSIFVSADGQPHVEIMSSEAFSSRYIDLRDSEDSGGHLSALVEKESTESFNLSKGPLIRAVLFQVSDDEHVFVLTQHHIVSDGWSMAVMIRELNELYSSHCRGAADSLPPLPIQYPDYAVWQRQWFTRERLDVQAEYWRKNLTGAPVLIDLPTDRPRPVQQSFAGSTIPISLDSELTSALKRLSQEHGTTLFMVIMAAWSAVLSRLSGQDDIVIGTPSANRGRSEIESLIGLFVNTLALRIDLSGEPTMMDVLDRVRRAALSAHDHQDLPFEQVVEIVQPPRSMGHTPLFQVMFAWQNNDDVSWDLVDLETSHYNLDISTIKFDLELGLHESEGKIVGELGYSTALFEQSTIERHVGYLTEMLREMSINIDAPVHAVDILSPTERTLLLDRWNTTQETESEDLCIHQMFEQQVERTPEAIALVFEDQSLTYGELNTRANHLAHNLVDLGVRPDKLVAICMERSLGLIVAIMAVLKAGGAYVPLDPIFASDRLRSILYDASPVCILADTIGRAALGDTAALGVLVLDPKADCTPGACCNVYVPHLTSTHLAYVIYTSGTTGKPKGVMIEHKGVVSLIRAIQEPYGYDSRTRSAQFFSFSFDASVGTMFPVLCNGGALYLLNNTVRVDKCKLWSYIEQNPITHLAITPSVLQDCNSLRPLNTPITLILLGESLSPIVLESVKALLPSGNIINEYGPTETTVFATFWKPVDGVHVDKVPIGRPIANKRLYILDNSRQPVPQGVMGELYIGGFGVARGYLSKPELTAEMFIRDPFVEDPEARMYKTGDLVRYLPDGNVIYLGRNDHQVKIRGFRVELGEIEACLNEHPSVSEAVVNAVGDGSSKRLVAYLLRSRDLQLAPQGTQEPTLAQTLHSYLSAILPDYMVPAAFIQMEEFPLTSNSKLDRKALPMPDMDAFAIQLYETPRDPIEYGISQIWADLLNVTRVGRHDDFFAIGGHSLLAVKMVSQLRTIMGFEIPLRFVFESPTIAKLVLRLNESKHTPEDAYKVLLPIKPQGSRAPLFCVHPAQGLSWCFFGLSKYVPPEQPLYGLQARGFFDDQEAPATLEEIAQDYIDQIRSIQDRGPYRLLGYSSGGLIAHTMAALLEKQGEQVALLAMMDTPANYRALYSLAGKKNNEVEDIPEHCCDQDGLQGDPANGLFKHETFLSKLMRLTRSSEPHVYGGDLVMLRASKPHVDGTIAMKSAEEWRPYVLGKIEGFDIASTHGDMIQPEPLAQIGRILSERLGALPPGLGQFMEKEF